MTDEQTFRPTEIRLNRDRNMLKVTFSNGRSFEFTAEFLRVNSPSAEVKGHSPKERKTVGGKKKVLIFTIESAGNYAIRPVFSDGHDTGLFSWAYLYEIGEDQDALWRRYLEELERLGLSRES